MIINGANSINYHPSASGNYTVVITDANGCTNTSSAYPYVTIGLETLNADQFHIYPNPVRSILTIEFTQSQIPNSIIIENMLGEKVLTLFEKNAVNKLFII